MNACGNPRMKESSLVWLCRATFSKPESLQDYVASAISIVSCVTGAVILDCSVFSMPWLRVLTVNVKWSAPGGLLENSSLSRPAAAPCQAHMSHIQLFRNVDLWLALASEAWWVWEQDWRGKGDVCVQLAWTKLSLSGLTLKSGKVLRLRRRKCSKLCLPYFCCFFFFFASDLLSAALKCKKHRETDMQRLYGWSEFCVRGSGF